MIYLFVLGRILVGGYFIMSGYNHFKQLANFTGYAESKGVPMAKLSVRVTGAMMILGGFGILLGVWIQFSIALIVIFLMGTLVKMHRYWEVADPMQKMGERVNFYKNVALIGGLLMTLAIPLPWALSLM